MKETKENNLIEISSKEDEKIFRQIGNGRKFFKIGERVVDICKQEIDRYKYENSNIFIRLFKLSNSKKAKEKYMLETKINSEIRSVAAYYIRKIEKEDSSTILNPLNISINVKRIILDAVNHYESNLKDKDNVININTKKEA